MKTTGIVRRMDDLGRIAIPKELTRRLGIKTGAPLELYLEKGAIVLKHYDVASDPSDTLDGLLDTLDGLLDTVETFDLLDDDQTVIMQAHIYVLRNLVKRAVSK